MVSIPGAGSTNITTDSIQPPFDAGRLDLVALGHRLCEKIDLVPSPGHAPGRAPVLGYPPRANALLLPAIDHHPVQRGATRLVCTFDED